MVDNTFKTKFEQKYTIYQKRNKQGDRFISFSIDGEKIFSTKNPSPEKLKGVKIFVSHDWYAAASGKVEHFMLTTPSCESKAPPDWDRKEVERNTFIYYKKFDAKTNAEAKAFCQNEGQAQNGTSNNPHNWHPHHIEFEYTELSI